MPEGSAIDVDAQPFQHLRAGGVSVVVDFRDRRLPTVRHWGADLGILNEDQLRDLIEATRPPYGDSPMDVVDQITLVPEHASAWLGRPGLEGGRTGRDWSTAFRVESVRIRDDADGQWFEVDSVDPVARLTLNLEIHLTPSGLLRLRARLVNDSPEPFAVGALRVVLPVPSQAVELLDFTGRHAMERIPQRQPFTMGVHSRESRLGRPGLDSAYVLMAGTAGFSHQQGEVWGLHLGWSGNQNVYAERLPNGARVVGAAELLEQNEVILSEGQTYRTPWTYAGYGGQGIDGLAGRFHQYLRGRPSHPSSSRPVLLNTWEAVYFNHDLIKLQELADRGAQIGVERFVLDDGWFAGRRDDTSSLGDWYVSADIWPNGLGPLVDHVRALGMEFGLWVEPEMVNLDSDLARAHPEWLFSAAGRVGLASRYQHVLDLAHPGAYDHVLDSLDRLLQTYDIGYLKWDHNRNLNDAGHTPDGTPGVHGHTMALYRLLDELRASHPGLEIETCAGGGGRIDLGILERTDRVWASDCIDALERQQIQRYTQVLLPPELIGTHIGSTPSHSTQRSHGLGFRAITAIWGHLGIEWDLTKVDDAELAEVGRWVDVHKRNRALLHTGTVVNVDHPDPAIWINGVVSADRREAMFGVTSLRRSETWPPGRLRFAGLDPEKAYAVSLEHPVDPHDVTTTLPGWTRRGITLPGQALMGSGVEMLPIHPEHAYLLKLVER